MKLSIPVTTSPTYPQHPTRTLTDPGPNLPDRPLISNSDDARNPPSEPYRDLLIEAGCEVMVHDPHVLEYPDVVISHDLDDVIKGADVVDADGFIGAGFVYKGIG